MPTVEATLQSTLGALVSGRCYPVLNPSPVAGQSYITFQVVAGTPANISDSQERKRVQIDVWSPSYDTAKALAESVKAAMDSAFEGCAMIMHFDGYEEASREHRQTLEYYIWP